MLLQACLSFTYSRIKWNLVVGSEILLLSIKVSMLWISTDTSLSFLSTYSQSSQFAVCMRSICWSKSNWLPKPLPSMRAGGAWHGCRWESFPSLSVSLSPSSLSSLSVCAGGEPVGFARQSAAVGVVRKKTKLSLACIGTPLACKSHESLPPTRTSLLLSSVKRTASL